MAKAYILYNLSAGYKTSCDDIELLQVILYDEPVFVEITKIKDYRVFLGGLDPEDCIVLCGGDGTLNRFINAADGISFDNEVLYYPIGTGNDFAKELGHEKGCTPFPITDYIKNLPVVTVKGRQYRFLNGVGYGIDGYCCEVGDALKKETDKPVSYTAIAIKGLLFHYKPTAAAVTVDGVTHTYKKVWIAPTMIGRYYGGGMIPAPHQNRNNAAHTVSVAVLHDSGKLKTLCVFPSIFKGEHIRHTEMTDVFTGHEITVAFDRPRPLQIDGETIAGVMEYTVHAGTPTQEEVRTSASMPRIR